MPRITPARRRQRENGLLDAARAVFADRGFEAASIADIARRAGVSDGLIYRYFRDKRDILTAILEQFFEDLAGRASATVRSVSGLRPKLRAFIEAHLSIMLEEPDLCRLFLIEMRNAQNFRGSRLHDLARRYTAIVVAIAREARESGEMHEKIDLRIFRDLVFGGMEHIGWHFLSGGSRHDAATTADKLAEVLIAGVGASTYEGRER